MRLRHTVGTALGALALVVTVPTSANAATGEFSYTYVDLNGANQFGYLENPLSGVCLEIPEATLPTQQPAFSAQNRTDKTASTFSEPLCQGTRYTVKARTGVGNARQKFRSVRFSV
ncbi:hypothetical protein [Streptomyces sp. TLI_146]|uniref:hypothetical protein n=1 Tax=Streptomyces sp. TLI_146 TaxID=1938858 RepID=UPI000C706632|nr:hypothetical protein [Streptomyces sp. TLI_146]PKV90150.1 hypothetical protein BX283_7830 [Streptomyces sp. TLI_146]